MSWGLVLSCAVLVRDRIFEAQGWYQVARFWPLLTTMNSPLLSEEKERFFRPFHAWAP
jgi:hypothetical protein